MSKKLKFIGAAEIVMAAKPKGFWAHVARPFVRLWFALCTVFNREQLKFIANLHPRYEGVLSNDQKALLDKLAEYTVADRFITKGGRLVYTLPKAEDVTLWQVIETRRAETATEMVIAWCTFPIPGNDKPTAQYAPDNVYHLLTASKYIAEQIELANALEKRLFPLSGDAPEETDGIEEAKNVLTLVQATAEVMACSFEDAKRTNFMDAIIALAKRYEENEKMRKQINK